MSHDYGAQVGDRIKITGDEYRERVGEVVIRSTDGWGNTFGVGVVLDPIWCDASRAVLWFRHDEYEVARP